MSELKKRETPSGPIDESEPHTVATLDEILGRGSSRLATAMRRRAWTSRAQWLAIGMVTGWAIATLAGAK